MTATKNDVILCFVWAGGLLMARFTPARNETIAWHYSQDGTMLGFELNGVPYFYVRNLQGDVVSVIDIDGNTVAWYTYDSWGNILEYGGDLAYTNPITYRGYYFDWELGLYYLQSRYYCPALRRFISADIYVDTGVGILGTNMYIYANNNPVMFVDPTGYSPLGIMRNWVTDTASSLWNRRGDIVDTYVKLFHEWLDDEIALLEQEWESNRPRYEVMELDNRETQEMLDFLLAMEIMMGVCVVVGSFGIGKLLPGKLLTDAFGLVSGIGSLFFDPGGFRTLQNQIREANNGNGVIITMHTQTGAATVETRPRN